MTEFESSPHQVDIPSLNVWRWQAERVATHLTGEPIGSYVARFFDNVDRTQFTFRPTPRRTPPPTAPEPDLTLSEWLTQEDFPETTRPLNTRSLGRFLSDCLEVDPSPVGPTIEAARITDYDAFKQRLGQVTIGPIGHAYGYWLGTEGSDRFKSALVTTLDLTDDGFIRTVPFAEGETNQRLAATMLSLDFDSLRE